MPLRLFFATTALIALAACSRPTGDSEPSPATGRAPGASMPTVADWPLPINTAAAQPDLVALPDGRLLLSWIEEAGQGHVLKLASFDGKAWSGEREVARGDDWFVNWADTPHVLGTADGSLWAHWLRRSATAKYAYDVVVAHSGDGGAHWSPPHAVNEDATPTEHGFVSMWAAREDALGIAWLDGRNSASGKAGHGGHDGHGEGAMTLRAAMFDATLRKSGETEIDPRTCDCCQTDAAMTGEGVLVAYRDRDGEEVRDIVTTRFDRGAWTLPRKVHDDRWTMPACPVNGPAIAARGNEAWVAWYTAAGDTPRVRVAHSGDAGERFDAPLELDSGAHVQGRVDVAVAGASTWVNWTREDASGQSLWIARLPTDARTAPTPHQVAHLQGRGRATGFPRMAACGDEAYLVWTDIVEGKPRLQGARIAAR